LHTGDAIEAAVERCDPPVGDFERVRREEAVVPVTVVPLEEVHGAHDDIAVDNGEAETEQRAKVPRRY